MVLVSYCAFVCLSVRLCVRNRQTGSKCKPSVVLLLSCQQCVFALVHTTARTQSVRVVRSSRLSNLTCSCEGDIYNYYLGLFTGIKWFLQTRHTFSIMVDVHSGCALDIKCTLVHLLTKFNFCLTIASPLVCVVMRISDENCWSLSTRRAPSSASTHLRMHPLYSQRCSGHSSRFLCLAQI